MNCDGLLSDKPLSLVLTCLSEAVTADEMTARIHKASGANAKVPKANLEALSLGTLKAICTHRGLSGSGGKVEMIESIESGCASNFGALQDVLCVRFMQDAIQEADCAL